MKRVRRLCSGGRRGGEGWGLGLTHRAVDTQRQQHDEEYDGPKRRAGQSGDGLWVDNEHQSCPWIHTHIKWHCWITWYNKTDCLSCTWHNEQVKNFKRQECSGGMLKQDEKRGVTNTVLSPLISSRLLSCSWGKQKWKQDFIQIFPKSKCFCIAANLLSAVNIYMNRWKGFIQNS